jgi:hypothetical protein
MIAIADRDRGARTHACNVHTFQKPLGPMKIPKQFVGQPIVAAAGFQPALFVSCGVGFCRKRRSQQGSSPAHVNALFLLLLAREVV